MKPNTLDERIHVLDTPSNVFSVIKEITESGAQEDAFYVCDVSSIVQKFQNWKEKLPRVTPYYAVKCNDSLIVLETMVALGSHFDCASRGEIKKIMSLGVHSNRIIYANPVKPTTHIKHAATSGVDLMTFDNESELYKTKRLFPNARLVIRIKCDDIGAQCSFGTKFGCDPVTEAPHLLETAYKLGLNVIGVSFHVGSGCKNPSIFKVGISLARNVFDLAKKIGFDFDFLDIGGGFPGHHGTSIDKIAEVINKSLNVHFSDPTIQVIAEPGRYFVASAFTLSCNIHSIRPTHKTDEKTQEQKRHFMYYMNDGVYGSFNNILYENYCAEPKLIKECPNSKLYSSSLWGPTCDSVDLVVPETYLPELKIGDWLMFENMGAYTITVASPFNGFPISKVHVVASEKTWSMLKDCLPLTEEHFVMGSMPANIKMGLDIGGDENWVQPIFPITFTIPTCGSGNILHEHTLSIDYVDVLH